MAKLTEMESRFDSGFLSSDKELLAALNLEVFGSPIRNLRCNDCYRDAYIMIVNKLKRKKTMPKKSNYVLKNGALIHPSGSSMYYTNPLSDEVAEEFLSKNRTNIKLFASYPNDWNERVDAYEQKKSNEFVASKQPVKNNEFEELKTALRDAEARETELKAIILSKEENEKALKAKIEELSKVEDVPNSQTEVPNLSDIVSELEGNVTTLESENMTLSEANARLTEQVNMLVNEQKNLKAENRALKAANTRLKKASADAESTEQAAKEA